MYNKLQFFFSLNNMVWISPMSVYIESNTCFVLFCLQLNMIP